MAEENGTVVGGGFLEDRSSDDYDWLENAWLRRIGSDPVEYDPKISGSIRAV